MSDVSTTIQGNAARGCGGANPSGHNRKVSALLYAYDRRRTTRHGVFIAMARRSAHEGTVKVDTAEIRALSVLGDVDPRSIRRVLDGKPVRGMAGRRARRVLIEAGLLEQNEEDE
jgi:hypothetical protein